MRQIPVLLCTFCALMGIAMAIPDGGDIPPLPGPGLSYGGIPYGSMSGNVAEFFKRQATSSSRSLNSQSYTSSGVDYSPIEQWL